MGNGEIEEQWEREVTEEEVNEAIGRVPIHKVTGTDEIDNETWKYATKSVRQGLVDLFNKVWCSGEIPVDWGVAIVIQIYKSGEKNDPNLLQRDIIIMYGLQYFCDNLEQKINGVRGRNG